MIQFLSVEEEGPELPRIRLFWGKTFHGRNVSLNSLSLWADGLSKAIGAINCDDRGHTVQLNSVNLTHRWWHSLLSIRCVVTREKGN